MLDTLSPARFVNPLIQWADLAVKTQEMLMSSGSVIQIRTQRMAEAGLNPSAADRAEFQRMGEEKLTAVNESGAAIAHELQRTQSTLVQRAVQHWLAAATAFFSLATSVTAAQAAERSNDFMQAASLSAASTSQLSSAPVRMVQQALEPIHAKATSNARRLTAHAAR